MGPKRILVIEDDADVRDSLRELLETAGVQVALAHDGVEGLERLREGPPPSAILLDLRLPRLGGTEFLLTMRADPRWERIPVVTMTAGQETAEDPGVHAHLRKPFDFDDLLQIVLTLCEPDAA